MSVLVEEGVEQDNGFEVVVDSAHDYVGEEFVLVREEAQYLLQAHPQRRLQQQDQKLQGTLALNRVFPQIDLLYIYGLRAAAPRGSADLLPYLHADRLPLRLRFQVLQLPEHLHNERTLAGEDKLLDSALEPEADGVEGEPG